MGVIVAIGGGELRDLETYKIDKEIVKLTRKSNPKALFIPTASGDAEGYWEVFREVYGNKLGCITDVLYLIRNKLKEEEIEQKIMQSDLIYVGGGNTQKMMEIWKKLKVDKYLKKAWEKGIVLSGLSAGSICWFKYGHSDSESFSGEDKWSYIKVDGLGLIHAFHCPHYNEDDRAEDFSRMIEDYDETGIALENNCAIVIVDDTYRVISSQEDAKAFKVYKKDGKVISEIIEGDDKFRDINELFV